MAAARPLTVLAISTLLACGSESSAGDTPVAGDAGTTASSSGGSSSSSSSSGGSTASSGALPGGGDDAGVAPGSCPGLRDDFSAPSLDTTTWRTIGFMGWTPEIVDARLTFTPKAGYANTRTGLVRSAKSFALTGCSVSVEVARALPAGMSGEVNVSLGVAGALVRARQGTLSFAMTVDDAPKTASIPYDPAAHRFWRFREAAGVLYLETAPEGRTWTERLQGPHGANLGDVQLGMNVIDTSISGVFDAPQFDNVNVVP